MDPLSLIPSILNIGAGMIGQNNTNQMQQQMMQQQQAFQERMSSTAYQRASTDMQAAGLNPMMMFSSASSASTPPGAAPSGNVKSGLDSDSMARALSTATQMRVADATINNLVEQNAKIKAETATERTKPGLVVAQTQTEGKKPDYLVAQKAKTLADADLSIADLPKNLNAGVTAKNEMDIDPRIRKIADQAGFAGRRVDQILSPVTSTLRSAKDAVGLFRNRWYYD